MKASYSCIGRSSVMVFEELSPAILLEFTGRIVDSTLAFTAIVTTKIALHTIAIAIKIPTSPAKLSSGDSKGKVFCNEARICTPVLP